jgi:Domain of unknown function DUF11
MRRVIPVLIVSFIAAGAVAQTSDLGIQKSATKLPIPGSGAGAYTIVVTNYGPQAAQPPIIVNDHIPAPGFFTGPVAAPWSCTPALSTHPTAITCQYAAPLAVGQSTTPLTLDVGVTSTPASISNCATVDAHVKDPNTANNRDCACLDFKPCRAVAIDLSTGVSNGASLATGATDPNWTIGTVPTGASVSGSTAYVPNINPWPATAPPARFISPKPPGGSSTPTTIGDYEYRFAFNLGQWRPNTCRLRFQYAADNSVKFFLDGNTTPFATSGTNVFSTLQAQVTALIATPPGGHVLRAVVNNTSSVTSLLVRGVVECTCSSFPPDPNPIGTSTAVSTQ